MKNRVTGKGGLCIILLLQECLMQWDIKITFGNVCSLSETDPISERAKQRHLAYIISICHILLIVQNSLVDINFIFYCLVKYNLLLQWRIIKLTKTVYLWAEFYFLCLMCSFDFHVALGERNSLFWPLMSLSPLTLCWILTGWLCCYLTVHISLWMTFVRFLRLVSKSCLDTLLLRETLIDFSVAKVFDGMYLDSETLISITRVIALDLTNCWFASLPAILDEFQRIVCKNKWLYIHLGIYQTGLVNN